MARNGEAAQVSHWVISGDSARIVLVTEKGTFETDSLSIWEAEFESPFDVLVCPSHQVCQPARRAYPSLDCDSAKRGEVTQVHGQVHRDQMG